MRAPCTFWARVIYCRPNTWQRVHCELEADGPPGSGVLLGQGSSQAGWREHAQNAFPLCTAKGFVCGRTRCSSEVCLSTRSEPPGHRAAEEEAGGRSSLSLVLGKDSRCFPARSRRAADPVSSGSVSSGSVRAGNTAIFTQKAGVMVPLTLPTKKPRLQKFGKLPPILQLKSHSRG